MIRRRCTTIRRRCTVAAGVSVFALGAVMFAPGSAGGYAVEGSEASTGAGTPGVFSGALADGATYEIQIPPHFNGTLFLYSHGYVDPGSFNPATDAGDLGTGAWLVRHGYAVAGSSYASTGWAVQRAIVDQLATVEQFDDLAGRPPRHIVAWGHSLGGLITLALAEESPGEISGALSLCGITAGASVLWNIDLAAMVAFRQLLAPDSALQATDIADPAANLSLAQQIASDAQRTAAGRARLALVSALAGIPGWFTPSTSAPRSPSGEEAAQYAWLSTEDLTFFADLRQQLAQLAGGNFASDAGFDFARALDRSPDAAEVRALYARAHLSLSDDLDSLAAAPVVRSSAPAAAYVAKFFSGIEGAGGALTMAGFSVPVLTLHTTGDGLVPDYNETVLRQDASRAHDASLLRQVFVSQAGHCTFSDDETIAAIEVIAQRVESGRWPSTSPEELNARAREAGASDKVSPGQSGGFASAPPSFVRFDPPPEP